MLPAFTFLKNLLQYFSSPGEIGSPTIIGTSKKGIFVFLNFLFVNMSFAHLIKKLLVAVTKLGLFIRRLYTK